MLKSLPLLALCLLLAGCPGPPVEAPFPLPARTPRFFETMFDTADCSGDKKVTEPEARTMIGILIGESEDYRPMTAAEFQQGDTNKDNYMTLAEFSALATAINISGYNPAGSTCPANTPASPSPSPSVSPSPAK